MFIHEGEEEDTDEEEWVGADGNAFDLFEIDEDWSISLRLWNKTPCNIFLGCRNKILSLNFISSILHKRAHTPFSSGKIREN